MRFVTFLFITCFFTLAHADGTIVVPTYPDEPQQDSENYNDDDQYDEDQYDEEPVDRPRRQHRRRTHITQNNYSQTNNYAPPVVVQSFDYRVPYGLVCRNGPFNVCALNLSGPLPVGTICTCYFPYGWFSGFVSQY